MMKLVSFLGLVGAAAAASSSAASSTHDIAPILKSSHRILSDEDGGEEDGGEEDGDNNAAQDLSAYSLQYSTCIKTKIASDDDAEGNSYYVNGAYRGQYNTYATFNLCTDSGNGQCTCDKSVEYATDMYTFLEGALAFLGGAAGNDETDYLDCTYSGADNGIDYYLGPQCSDTGGLIIGTFYDDECTVKASYSAPSFSYTTFSAIQTTCQSCANGGCDDLVEDSHQCSNGYDLAGDDDEGVCKAAKRATAVVDYSRVKARNSGAVLFAKVCIGMLVIGLVGGAMFFAYTYYIRHRGDRSDNLVEQVTVDAALT